MSLQRETVKGTIWTILDVLINKGSYFLASLYIARIIGPEKFGLISSFSIFVSIGTVLIDGGLTTSLIRSRNLVNSDYNTVFVINLSLSLILYLIIYFASVPIAIFFREPILINIIRVYCIGFIIFGFRSVHMAKLLKEMEFKKITLLSLPGNVVAVVISMWLVNSGYGVWALVSLFMVNQLITTFLMWLCLGWNPKIEFNVVAFRSHFNFGYKLLIAAQLNAIFDNLNNFIIGRIFSLKSLGYFDRAYTLNYTPVSILSGVISKVTFSSFSLISEDRARMRAIYKQILQLVVFLSATMLAFVIVFAEPIIELLLGKNWITIVPLMKILSLSFILFPVHSLNVNVLNIYGRSDLFLKLEIIKKIIFLIILLLSLKFGLNGLAWGSVLFSVVSLVINTSYSKSFLDYSLNRQIVDLIPTLFIVLISSNAVYHWSCFFNCFSQGFRLGVGFVIYMTVIIILCHLFKLPPYKHLFSIIQKTLQQ